MHDHDEGPSGAKAQRFLIVDDDPVALMVLERLLAAAGYHDVRATADTLRFAATGASLLALIVTLTVASAVSEPSLTRNVNASAPVRFAPGVYVRVTVSAFGIPLVQPLLEIAPSVPLAGPLTMENWSSHCSASKPASVTGSGVSSPAATV